MALSELVDDEIVVKSESEKDAPGIKLNQKKITGRKSESEKYTREKTKPKKPKKPITEVIFDLIRESNSEVAKRLKTLCFGQKGQYKQRNNERYKKIALDLILLLLENGLLK